MSNQPKGSATKAEKAMMGRTGVDNNYWAPPAPTTGLISAVLCSDIEKQKVVMMDSSSVVAREYSHGNTVAAVPLAHYRASTYSGRNRRKDAADFLSGKSPLYSDIDHFKTIHSNIEDLVRQMLNYYEPRVAISMLASMEMQDLNKITAQQWKPTGYFLDPQASDQMLAKGSEHIRKKYFDLVVKKYVIALEGTPYLKMGHRELIMEDWDPSDTMTGLPTCASGARSHEARLAMLSCLPNPFSLTPRQFISGMQGLGAELGLVELSLMYSPMLSTRFGPRNKFMRIWERVPGGYRSHEEYKALYNRVRFVWPAPYHVNFMLSPLYVQMSNARQRINGLWHDPVSQSKYIPLLQNQGDYAVSIDFSGMDTCMHQQLIMEMLQSLQRGGFHQWTTEFFMTLYPMMGLVIPSVQGTTGQGSLIKGPTRTWASGFKLTSEMDTHFGAATILSCLDQIYPGTSDKWLADQFTFGELGDDIVFTLPSKLTDEQKAAVERHALQVWNAKLEIINDSMFLKWFLPLTPEIKVPTRSLSRFIQQTFFNEEKYDGSKGGTRPNAVMRLALAARTIGLQQHPDIGKWWPTILSVLHKLKFMEDAPAEYIKGLESLQPVLTPSDVAEIMRYSLTQPGYFDDILSRSKFEPSAAALVEYLTSQGYDALTAFAPAHQVIRKMYLDALETPRQPWAYQALIAFVDAAISRPTSDSGGGSDKTGSDDDTDDDENDGLSADEAAAADAMSELYAEDPWLLFSSIITDVGKKAEAARKYEDKIKAGRKQSNVNARERRYEIIDERVQKIGRIAEKARQLSVDKANGDITPKQAGFAIQELMSPELVQIIRDSVADEKQAEQLSNEDSSTIGFSDSLDEPLDEFLDEEFY